jgi:hypothetical protein
VKDPDAPCIRYKRLQHLVRNFHIYAKFFVNMLFAYYPAFDNNQARKTEMAEDRGTSEQNTTPLLNYFRLWHLYKNQEVVRSWWAEN